MTSQQRLLLSPAYTRFASVYDTASQELSQRTWQRGILAEIAALVIPEMTVLDLGCGTGIGGRLMSSLGLSKIIGVDSSYAMLSLARPHYLHVEHVHLEDIPSSLGKFDLIVSGFDSLNYLCEAQLERVLSLARNLLRDARSRIFFDYSSPFLLQTRWQNIAYDQILTPRQRLRWHHSYQGGTGTVTWLTLFEDDIAMWTESHVQYTLPLSGIKAVATRAGLSVITARDLCRQSYSEAVDTHLYVLS